MRRACGRLPAVDMIRDTMAQEGMCRRCRGGLLAPVAVGMGTEMVVGITGSEEEEELGSGAGHVIAGNIGAKQICVRVNEVQAKNDRYTSRSPVRFCGSLT